MKIYVVTSGYYCDYHIEKVFADKKAAEAYCKGRNLYNFGDDEYSANIEEYETGSFEEIELTPTKILGEFNHKGELVNKTMFDNETPQEPFITEKEYGDIVTAYITPRRNEEIEDFRNRAEKVLIDTYYCLTDKRFKERRKQWHS